MKKNTYLSDETIHRTPEGILVSNKVVRVGIGKAVTIVVSAMLAGFGGAMFVRITTALSLPGRVDAVEADIRVIETKMQDEKNLYMPLDLSKEKWANNEKEHVKIESALVRLETKVDNIIKILK